MSSKIKYRQNMRFGYDAGKRGAPGGSTMKPGRDTLNPKLCGTPTISVTITTVSRLRGTQRLPSPNIRGPFRNKNSAKTRFCIKSNFFILWLFGPLSRAAVSNPSKLARQRGRSSGLLVERPPKPSTAVEPDSGDNSHRYLLACN